MSIRLYWILFSLLTIVAETFSQTQAELTRKVFLLGNTRGISEESIQWEQLSKDITKSKGRRTILVLGDFTNDDPKAIQPLSPALLNLYRSTQKDKKVDWFFVSGDRDWDNSGLGGKRRVAEIESYFRKTLKDKKAFLPRDGCPGPKLVELDENTVLVAINSQWFMHPYPRPEIPETECKAMSELDFWDELKETLDEARGKNIIIAAHHPVYSTGQYAGKRLGHFHWIPIGGTIYAAFRQQIGRTVDMAHPKYKSYAANMQRLLREHPSTVYVSGHEFDLQAHFHEGAYHLNSGSIFQGRKVDRKKTTVFAKNNKGYLRLDYFNNGQIDLFATYKKGEKISRLHKTLFAPDDDDKSLAPTNLSQYPAITPLYDHPEDTLLVAGKEYRAAPWQAKIMGKNYREEWTQPIKTDYLRIDTLFGGLVPIGKGGGLQTNSLKFLTPDGREYAFRQINKDPVKALDPLMKQTIYKLIVKDLIVTQHPYGGLVAAHLMDSTDILHVDPILCAMPDAEYLGPYRDEFKHRLGTLELRPKSPKKGEEGFAGADKIHSSNKMFKAFYEDNDNRIDAVAYARARMFDFFVGDWDRHEDNWKWAAFKEGKQQIYRPIPRDRDHVFSMWGGVLPSIADKVVPNAENFGFDFDNIMQLSFKARHLDRQLAVSLTREDWQEAAQYIQERMTDELIDASLLQLPPEVQTASAPIIAAKLKSRRPQLVSAANQLYDLLAKEVTVVGSNKREIFDVFTFPNGEMTVKVYDRKSGNGKRGKQLYERHFLPKETKEIQLYGLGGDDLFTYNGFRVDKTKVRVIGGGGHDSIVDLSRHTAHRKEWLIYNSKGEDIIVKGPSTNFREPKRAAKYNNKAFEYPASMPIPAFRISSGNRFGFELRYTYLARGFNKPEFKSKYEGKFIYYPRLKAHRLDIRYWYRHVMGLTDLHASWRWSTLYDKFPFFYNIGNDSERDLDLADTDFYRTDFNTSQFFIGFQRTFLQKSTLTYGVRWDRNNVSPLDNEFTIFNYSENGLELQYHLGITTELELDFRDNPKFTLNGSYLYLYHQLFLNDTRGNELFGRFDGHLAYYYSFSRKVTLALRAGGSKSYGEVPFYQLSALGSNAFLRAYVRNRFLGDAAAFADSEVRAHLGTWRTILAPIKYGVFVFYDTGRVWSDVQDESDIWHYGYGGGAYAAPLNENFNFVFTYGRNRDKQSYISFRVGFRLQ